MRSKRLHVFSSSTLLIDTRAATSWSALSARSRYNSAPFRPPPPLHDAPPPSRHASRIFAPLPTALSFIPSSGGVDGGDIGAIIAGRGEDYGITRIPFVRALDKTSIFGRPCAAAGRVGWGSKDIVRTSNSQTCKTGIPYAVAGSEEAEGGGYGLTNIPYVRALVNQYTWDSVYGSKKEGGGGVEAA